MLEKRILWTINFLVSKVALFLLLKYIVESTVAKQLEGVIFNVLVKLNCN